MTIDEPPKQDWQTYKSCYGAFEVHPKQQQSFYERVIEPFIGHERDTKSMYAFLRKAFVLKNEEPNCRKRAILGFADNEDAMKHLTRVFFMRNEKLVFGRKERFVSKSVWQEYHANPKKFREEFVRREPTPQLYTRTKRDEARRERQEKARKAEAADRARLELCRDEVHTDMELHNAEHRQAKDDDDDMSGAGLDSPGGDPAEDDNSEDIMDFDDDEESVVEPEDAADESEPGQQPSLLAGDEPKQLQGPLAIRTKNGLEDTNEKEAEDMMSLAMR
ncbi:MAG: hypothetical protein Q9227_005136 [Pyrenula ochraceoflavens]